MQTLDAGEDTIVAILGSIDSASFQFVEQVVMHRRSAEYKLIENLKYSKHGFLGANNFHTEKKLLAFKMGGMSGE